MRHLQELYEKYKDRGMVIVGFNCTDDRGIARALLRANGVTFPNVRDGSRIAAKVMFDRYKTSGVPLNYIIDREGEVVDAWYGNEEDFKRALSALEKAGLKLENE